MISKNTFETLYSYGVKGVSVSKLETTTNINLFKCLRNSEAEGPPMRLLMCT